MASFKAIAAAAWLSALAATPAFAQAAIGEPGAFAFYHPDVDVLNRTITPAGRGFAEPPPASQSYAATRSGVGTRHSPRYRSYHTNR